MFAQILLPRISLICILTIVSITGIAFAQEVKPAIDMDELLGTSINYSSDEFDVAATKIPSEFEGINPAYAIAMLGRIFESNNKKGEFESSDEFKHRIDTQDEAPIIGSLTVTSTYAFKLASTAFTSEYNTDSEQLRVSFESTDTHVLRTIGKTDKYDATNAFGAQVQVSRGIEILYGLSIQNKKRFRQNTNHGKLFCDLHMDTPTAFKAKPNISIIAVCHLTKSHGHYFSEKDHTTKPTFTIPIELTESELDMNVNVDEYIIYNSSEGTIYSVLKPESI